VQLPFEVWVNGIEQPRGLNALAINLSYDMYARDRGWLSHKLDALEHCAGEDETFDLPMPPRGEPRRVPSLVAAMAILIRYRCEQLGAFAGIRETPLLDALMTRAEPRRFPEAIFLMKAGTSICVGQAKVQGASKQ